jgi:CHAT domain-containing protein
VATDGNLRGGVEKYEIKRYTLLLGEKHIRMVSDRRHWGPCPINYDRSRLEWRTLEHLVDMLRDNRVRQQETELLGEHLYRLILDNEIGKELHNTLTNNTDVFLHVEVHVENPQSEFVNLPWEYLFYRDTNFSQSGYFLAAHNRVALVRSPRVDNCRALRLKMTATEKQLRLLTVACSPSDLPRLDFAALLESVKGLPELEVEMLITNHTSDPRFETKSSGEPRATQEGFKAALKQFKPHVVHFLGHGKCDSNGGKIAFVEKDYRADWCNGRLLANALSDHASVRLAFLQACESAVGDSAVAYRALSSVAGDLVQTGIPAIVAMQANVENAAANSFADAFYRAVIEQRQPIYRAMQLARTRFGEAACIPVLYMGQDKDGENKEGLLFPSTPPEQTSSPLTAIGATAMPPAASEFICPWCHKKAEGFQDGDMYCEICRSPIICPSCRHRLPKIDSGQESTYCRRCRSKLSRYVEPPVPGQSQPDGFDKDAASTLRIKPENVTLGQPTIFSDQGPVEYAEGSCSKR